MQGNLVIDFPTSRSISPTSLDVKWIEISGHRNDDSSVMFTPQHFPLGGSLSITGLSVGSWTFSVVGYGTDPALPGAIALTSAATDSNVVIQSGKTTTASFVLHYLNTGTGSYSITVGWPDGLATFSKVETVVGTARTEGVLGTSSALMEGSATVGDYPVEVVFTNRLGTQISFPYMEMVNVYHGLDAEGSISFEAADFVQVQSPSITASDGTGGQLVTMSCASSGAVIHYTTDGSDPTTSATTVYYEAPFTLKDTKTVRAVAVQEGCLNSVETNKEFAVGQVAIPSISPAGGLFSVSQQVTMSCATEGATIRYTLDGTEPTGSSSLYNGTVTLTGTATVRAIAMKSGMLDSLASSQSYTMMDTVATPAIDVTAVIGGQQVSMSCATSGAVIRYTTDGSDPTSSSAVYTTSFMLTETKTIKAIAMKPDMTNSTLATKLVSVSEVSTPWITPATSDFSGSVTVTLNNLSGVVMYYTTDGSTPTEDSQVYSGSFTLDASATVKAIGVKKGEISSGILSKSYTRVYTVGETGPAGGKIFYVNDGHTYGSWTYLEAAPEDEKILYVYGGYQVLIGVGAQGVKIGTGENNTEEIVIKYKDHDPNYYSRTYAAKVCGDKSLTSNGVVYDDWFLPSKDELNQMYLEKDTIGGFTKSWYWSSTEKDKVFAARQANSGEYNYTTKDVFCAIRAIRAF